MADPIKCFLLDHGLDTHGQDHGPCCHQPIVDVRNFSNLHRNPIWMEIKESFDQGVWPEKYCVKCRTIEKSKLDSHVRSKRQSAEVKYKYVKNRYGSLKKDQLYALVVDTGRLCNFQCRTCGPSLSSSWIPEWNAMPADIKPWPNKITYKVWPHLPYDPSKDDLSQLQWVSLIGGEPLYNIESYGILERIFEATKGECDVNISTNGSIPLDLARYPYLAQFRKLHITFSVDATDKAFEFIRTGGNWKRVNANIAKIRSLPNCEITFHPALGVLNLFEVPSLKSWASETDITWSRETTYITDPYHMSYGILTDREKSIVRQWLGQFGYEYICDVFDNFPFNPTEREKFFKTMEHTKNHHGMDWQEYLPQLYELMTSG